MKFIDLVENCLEFVYFSKDKEKAPIQYNLEKTVSENSVLVVTGENASGKSFYSKLFRAFLKREFPKTSFMYTCFADRSASSLMGIQKTFMYGDENYFSTGDNSVKAAVTGINSAIGWKKDVFLFLDEPDIGLSPGYCFALGEYIGEKVQELKSNSNFKGLVLVTHSPFLIRALKTRTNFHHLRIGDDLTLGKVLQIIPQRKSIEDLLKLKEKGHEKYKAIQKIINNHSSSSSKSKRKSVESRTEESDSP